MTLLQLTTAVLVAALCVLSNHSVDALCCKSKTTQTCKPSNPCGIYYTGRSSYCFFHLRNYECYTNCKCTVCAADEYETRAPKVTTDRACAKRPLCCRDSSQTSGCKCTECTVNQYQTRAPGLYNDRQCASLRVCTSNEYEYKAPTSTSNRECRPRLSCCKSTNIVRSSIWTGRVTTCPNFGIPTGFSRSYNIFSYELECATNCDTSGVYLQKYQNSATPARCVACPKGFFQTRRSNFPTSCERCGTLNNKPLTTLGTGATSKLECVEPTLTMIGTSHRIFLLPEQGTYQYECVEITTEFFERNQGALSTLEIYTDTGTAQGEVESSTYQSCTATYMGKYPNLQQKWESFPISFSSTAYHAEIGAFSGQQFLINAYIVSDESDLTSENARTTQKKVETVCGCVDHTPPTGTMIITKLQIASHEDNLFNGEYTWSSATGWYKNSNNKILVQTRQNRWGLANLADYDGNAVEIWYQGGICDVTGLQLGRQIPWLYPNTGLVQTISVIVNGETSPTGFCKVDDREKGQLDCVSAATVRDLSYYNDDTTGRPGSFHALQRYGKVHFRWDDFSICESAFSFSRDELPFIKDVISSGILYCGERYEYMEEVFDDLTEPIGNEIRPIGTKHEYCVKAISDTGVGEIDYSSGSTCADFELRWEGRIAGYVLTQVGLVPVEGVDFRYNIYNLSGTGEVVKTGTATTLKDGYFELHIIDDGPEMIFGTAEVLTVEVMISKGSGVDAHSFVCGHAKCGGYDPVLGEPEPPMVMQIPLRHFQFDLSPNSLVTVYDASSVPWSGQIFYPLTAAILPPRVDSAPLPDWEPEGVTTCAVRDATVCLHDYDQQESVIACVQADENGGYVVAAPIRTRVVVKVTYGDHTPFVRAGQQHACRKDRPCSDIESAWLESTAVPTPDTDLSLEDAEVTEEEDTVTEIEYVEVFTVTPTSIFERMDYFDLQSQKLELDVHGTLCKFPIGKEATFSIVSAKVPCNGEDLEITVSTEGTTLNTLILPSHALHITLEALEPAYPQVTDESEFGYFHRLLTRRRFIDLDEDPSTETEEDITDEEPVLSEDTEMSEEDAAAVSNGLPDVEGAVEETTKSATTSIHQMVFRYHPKPSLTMEFLTPDGEPIEETGCTEAEATDTELAQSSSYEPSLLIGSAVPQWSVHTATEMVPQINVFESIPYPDRNAPKVCDWIENAAVQHHNQLGFSTSDLINLQRDPNTAEFKEFANIVHKTIGSPLEESEPYLTICRIPGDPACAVPVQHTPVVDFSTRFEDDYTCDSYPDGTQVPDFHPVDALSNLSPAPRDADEKPKAVSVECTTGWKDITSVAGSRYRHWHLLEWDALQTFEQGYFRRLGLEQIIRQNTRDTWQEYTKEVLMSAPHWNNLTKAEQEAASELEFTSETWGRPWAFLDRIHHQEVSIEWNDENLLPGEEGALITLGWSRASWNNFGDDPATAKVSWDELTEEQQFDAYHFLRIDRQHWNSVLEEKNKISGCFWDFGRFDIVSETWVVEALSEEEARRRHRHRRQLPEDERDDDVDEEEEDTCEDHEFIDYAGFGCDWYGGTSHENECGEGYELSCCEKFGGPLQKNVDPNTGRFALDACCVCGGGNRDTENEDEGSGESVDGDGVTTIAPGAAGPTVAITCESGKYAKENRRTGEFTCSDCPAGEYKDENMTAAKSCIPKRLDCPNKETLYKMPQITGTESATEDDTFCVPDGYCPPGMFLDRDNCEVCPDGSFSLLHSKDRTCNPKTITICPAGEYLVNGTSPIYDDNICVKCGSGTFSPAAGAFNDCEVKQFPSRCEAGQQVSLGSSATEDDSGCTNCTEDTFNPEASPSLTACVSKTILSCPPGYYFRRGPSRTLDDNSCIRCPHGTFSASTSTEAACDTKEPTVCAAGEYLSEGVSAVESDNYCVKEGMCPPGTFMNDNKKCKTCPKGFFASHSSNSSGCTQKGVVECPAGHHVDQGTSSKRDDSRCLLCPSGTYSNETSSASCYIKQPLVETCGKGFYVSSYTSLVMDDSACVRCTAGRYSDRNSSETSCLVKRSPDLCRAGYFLDLGTSTEEDDWVCTMCDTGTYSATASDSTFCNPKRTEDDCVEGVQYLRKYNDPKLNDECKVPALCPAGTQLKEAFGEECEDCPVGTFNGVETENNTEACVGKVGKGFIGDEEEPYLCDAGQYVLLGLSKVRDDWRCARCPFGTYRSASTTAQSCRAKVEPSSCPPGEFVKKGDSIFEDDWMCAPPPRVFGLCMKETKKETRSSLPETMWAGMPELIEPFTKQYHGWIQTPGYDRVKISGVVVVTGPRFVSDTERVPFPEGLPLLVLHDPPGGNSFSAFHHQQLEVTFVDAGFGFGLSAGLDFGLETKVGVDMELEMSTEVLAAPLGVGASIGVEPPDPLKLEIGASKGFGLSTNLASNMGASFSNRASKLSIEFSYQTSAEPDKAGPPQDTFLMPAVTFEVTKVWVVSFAAGDDVCLIKGRMDITLKANPDLSGFYFTQANDVETRTLPLLKLVSADINKRFECASGGECCTEEETEMGCSVTTNIDPEQRLKQYCSFKHKEGTDAWLSCWRILEDDFKTQCTKALGQEKKNFFTVLIDLIKTGILDIEKVPPGECHNKINGIVMKDIDGYCKERERLGYETFADCISFRDPRETEKAYNDWYKTLDRNYLHQEKASNPSLDLKYSNINRLPGDPTKVTVPELQGMAPEILIKTAKNTDGTEHTNEVKDKYRSYNVISFEGGGSTVEYVTNKFPGSDIKSHERTTKIDFPSVEASIGLSTTMGLDLETAIFGAEFGIGFELGLSTEIQFGIYSSMTIDSSEGVSTMFHFEDPDVGDYFVVSVFTDPDYGTPLFSLDGGASSCQWEVGSAHRSAPGLEWEYIGPPQIAPDQPALFKVKVSNAINYYAAGPESRFRPHWMGTDTGYVAPDMTFYIDKATVSDGLGIVVNGHAVDQINFEEFGKGTLELLVEVYRGPLAYEYDPPTLGWRESCSGPWGPNGENKYSEKAVDPVTGIPFYAIGMRTYGVEGNKIVFQQPCPKIQFSGSILSDGTFSVTSDPGSRDVAVDVVVLNEANGNAPRPVTATVVEHRLYKPTGPQDKWDTLSSSVGSTFDEVLYSHTWSTSSLRDGVYELRVMTNCGSGNELPSKLDVSYSDVVIGIVDRQNPSVVSMKYSSGGPSWGPGDDIVIQYNEDIVCDDVDISVRLNDQTFQSGGQVLNFVCLNKQVRIGFPGLGPQIASDLLGASAYVTIQGVSDQAGNAAEALLGTVIASGASHDAASKSMIETLQTMIDQKFDAQLKMISALQTLINADAAEQLAEAAAKQEAAAQAAAEQKAAEKAAAEAKQEADAAAAAAEAADAAKKQAEEEAEIAENELKELENADPPDLELIEEKKQELEELQVVATKAAETADQANAAASAAAEENAKAEAAVAEKKEQALTLQAEASQASEAADAGVDSASGDDKEYSKETLTVSILLIIVVLIVLVIVVGLYVKMKKNSAVSGQAEPTVKMNSSRGSFQTGAPIAISQGVQEPYLDIGGGVSNQSSSDPRASGVSTASSVAPNYMLATARTATDTSDAPEPEKDFRETNFGPDSSTMVKQPSMQWEDDAAAAPAPAPAPEKQSEFTETAAAIEAAADAADAQAVETEDTPAQERNTDGESSDDDDGAPRGRRISAQIDL